jgi:SAM-dependent MidA family methyltransferase
MEWCLYHPRYGYYQSGRTRIGREGDYYTSSCVHPLFGGMIAKQLIQMAEILGEETFEVIEMGGANGSLCQDILHWAREKEPFFYRRMKYTLLETSLPFLNRRKNSMNGRRKERSLGWTRRNSQMEGFKGWGAFSPMNSWTLFRSIASFLTRGD